MALEIGTRRTDNFHKSRADSGSNTRGYTRDLGIKKNVTASFTFTASNGRITGAGALFASTFAVGDPAVVGGTNKNNGYFTVVALDGANNYLQLDPPPKDEGPLTCNIRTS